MTSFQEIASDLQAKQAFIIGPNQEAWLAALESGKYEQGRGRLRDYKDRLCCLGVLCEVAGIPAVRMTSGNWRYADKNATAPWEAQQFVKLRSDCGNRRDQQHSYCTAMNDSGATFKEIARRIRAEPEQYFTESRLKEKNHVPRTSDQEHTHRSVQWKCGYRNPPRNACQFNDDQYRAPSKGLRTDPDQHGSVVHFGHAPTLEDRTQTPKA